jgi:hypothetical protein
MPNSECRLAAILLTSACDCKLTKFGGLWVGINFEANPTASALTVTRGGNAETVSLLLHDSVSYSCATGDGLSFCGARTFSIIDKATGLTPKSLVSFIVVQATQTVDLTIRSIEIGEGGTHQYTLLVSLNDYSPADPLYAVHTDPFTVNVIDPCDTSELDIPELVEGMDLIEV